MDAINRRVKQLLSQLGLQTAGNMDFLNKRTITTSRGFTYTYYTQPAKSGKPTILMLHGWPDHAELWEGLIHDFLQPAGYGVVAPDCLGYDGTDKPIDPEAYNWNGLTGDICEILDKEGVDKVVSMGHDWGSEFSQRFYLFRPERCAGLVNLNVAYHPPSSGPMDLGAAIRPMEERIGYFPFWYWFLFSDPVEGPQLLNGHLESMFTVLHGDPSTWLDLLCKKDGVKDYLKADRRQRVLPYATEATRRSFMARFKRDGFAAPLCWYRAAVEGVHGTEEMKLPKERSTVQVPYLFVAGLKDAVCLPAAIDQAEKQGLTPKLTKKSIDGGHWSMLSHPQETGEMLIDWLNETYGTIS